MLSLLLLAAARHPLVGEWRGTSLCQVRPSPCNDEQAVYMIEGGGSAYVVHFGKVVRGKPEEFGAMPGSFDAKSGQLIVVGHGRGGDFIWKMQAKGDHLTGVLRKPDGTVYRKADLKRVSTAVRPIG
jgi:hypothetical protein